MKKFLCVILTAFAFFKGSFLFANETSIKGLYSYTLPNGLKLFVAENHSVPLTYIELAVRCGAYTQTPENTGLFHLYEHMIFKGNKLYKDSSSVNKALSDIGVSGKNGSTDIEWVNYYFTVPSDQTKKGLEFWSAAIQNPVFDKKEFEAEKKVVISEINGKKSSPSFKAWICKNELLFKDAPYKIDSAGVEKTIQNATIKQLKDIQKKYYVPNNSAIFVGGDVSAQEVYELVKKLFVSWKRSSSPFEGKNAIVQHDTSPFSKTELRVMPFDKISQDFAQVSVEFRGPDAYFAEDDTYIADVLLFVLSEPNGFFKKHLVSDGALGIPDTNYISVSYPTRKTCGVISFYSSFVLPEEDMEERSVYFSNQLSDFILKTINSLSEEDLKKVLTYLEDEEILSRQTAKGLLEGLRFWWCATSEDYYFSYAKKISQVTKEDLLHFVEKYISQKNPLVTVYINPSVYEQTKENFNKAGFKLLGSF